MAVPVLLIALFAFADAEMYRGLGYQVSSYPIVDVVLSLNVLTSFFLRAQWASFLAGCIALVLAATPWVLFRYGPEIRARVSPFLAPWTLGCTSCPVGRVRS